MRTGKTQQQRVRRTGPGRRAGGPGPGRVQPTRVVARRMAPADAQPSTGGVLEVSPHPPVVIAVWPASALAPGRGPDDVDRLLEAAEVILESCPTSMDSLRGPAAFTVAGLIRHARELLGEIQV